MEGLSCSSCFEVQLARHIIGDSNYRIHFTSPGIRDEDYIAIHPYCDYLSFNTLTQASRLLSEQSEPEKHYGIRVNPEVSVVADARYNPCRKHSKLGASMAELNEIWSQGTNGFIAERIDGIHLHNNCNSLDFAPLLDTVKNCIKNCPAVLEKIGWINLGGGYFWASIPEVDLAPFYEAIALLKERFDVQIIIEPGSGIVADSMTLIASVVDLFETDGKKIAVLDTTVNHLPEVFEYQYRPEIAEHSEQGKHEYLLAGASCLAGDLFGCYRFEEPLKIGTRIRFPEQGSYSIVKAHMFNGINMPDLYACNERGELELIKQHDFTDFLSRAGGANECE